MPASQPADYMSRITMGLPPHKKWDARSLWLVQYLHGMAPPIALWKQISWRAREIPEREQALYLQQAARTTPQLVFLSPGIKRERSLTLIWKLGQDVPAAQRLMIVRRPLTSIAQRKSSAIKILYKINYVMALKETIKISEVLIFSFVNNTVASRKKVDLHMFPMVIETLATWNEHESRLIRQF